MTVFIATFVVFGLAMLALAVGVLLGRGAIKGSCGGLANVDGAADCPYCSGNCENAPAENAVSPRRSRAGIRA